MRRTGVLARRLATVMACCVVAVLAWVAPARAADDANGGKAREAALALVRGHLDQAITLYGEALEDRTLSNDRRAALHNDRGVAFARRGKHRQAFEDYNRAIQLYPEFAAVYNNRGNLLLGLGATAEAVKDFDRAIALAPGYAAAFSNRAGAYVKLGDNDRAFSDYARAIELTPTSPAALNGRGRAHLTAWRPHAAIRDFTRAVNTDNRFGPAYRSRAEAAFAVDRYDDAVEDFSRAIAFEPRNPEIYVLRGNAYLGAGNTNAALKDYATAVEIAPGQAAYYAMLGHAHAKSEAYDDALNNFARAIELDPKAALPYAYRAFTYLKRNELELAGRDVERALRLDRESAEGFWARGEIALALSRSEDAAADFRRAIELGERLKDANRALARLGLTATPGGGDLVPNAGLDGWRVHQMGRQYVALNSAYPRLRVNLEMMGPGTPRILEWQIRPQPFEGIGTLRFSAGAMPTSRGLEEVEHTALIDVQNQTVISVQVHRQGNRLARWTWEEGRLLVASADGITDELQLRQMRPKEPPPQTAHRRDPPRKPKTLFELLFGL